LAQTRARDRKEFRRAVEPDRPAVIGEERREPSDPAAEVRRPRTQARRGAAQRATVQEVEVAVLRAVTLAGVEDGAQAGRGRLRAVLRAQRLLHPATQRMTWNVSAQRDPICVPRIR